LTIEREAALSSSRVVFARARFFGLSSRKKMLEEKRRIKENVPHKFLRKLFLKDKLSGHENDCYRAGDYAVFPDLLPTFATNPRGHTAA
jgi:hypothetical protein